MRRAAATARRGRCADWSGCVVVRAVGVLARGGADESTQARSRRRSLLRQRAAPRCGRRRQSRLADARRATSARGRRCAGARAGCRAPLARGVRRSEDLAAASAAGGGSIGIGSGRFSADLASCSADIAWYMSKPMKLIAL